MITLYSLLQYFLKTPLYDNNYRQAINICFVSVLEFNIQVTMYTHYIMFISFKKKKKNCLVDSCKYSTFRKILKPADFNCPQVYRAITKYLPIPNPTPAIIVAFYCPVCVCSGLLPTYFFFSFTRSDALKFPEVNNVWLRIRRAQVLYCLIIIIFFTETTTGKRDVDSRSWLTLYNIYNNNNKSQLKKKITSPQCFVYGVLVRIIPPNNDNNNNNNITYARYLHAEQLERVVVIVAQSRKVYTYYNNTLYYTRVGMYIIL